MASKKSILTLLILSVFLCLPLYSFASSVNINPKAFTRTYYPLTNSHSGNTGEFNIQFVNSSSEQKQVDFSVVLPNSSWIYALDNESLTVPGNSNVTNKLFITSPDELSNGIYYFELKASVDGSVVSAIRGDFIVSEYDAPSPLSQRGYNMPVGPAGRTYDTRPEFNFNLLGDGKFGQEFARGDPYADYFGEIKATHLEDNVAIKVFQNGVVGHLWSAMSGWIILDADGVPGSNNDNVDDFGVVGVGIGDNIHLSGLAWSQSAGWIYISCNDLLGGAPVGCSPTSLLCESRGAPQNNNFNVCIDQNNQFYGHAWSENLGWINFESVNENPFEFRIQISKDPGFTSTGLMIESSGKVDSSSKTYRPNSDLPEGSAIYWRVREENIEEGSEWSDAYSIYIKEEPEIALISPPDDPDGDNPIGDQTPDFSYEVLDKLGSLLSVTITIQKKDATDNYVDYHSQTQSVTINSTTMQQKVYNHTSPPLLPGQYRWRAKAIDEKNNKGETDFWHFTVGGESPIVDCLSPKDGETISERMPELEFSVNEPDDQDIDWKIEIIDTNGEKTIRSYSGYQTDPDGATLTHQVQESLMGGNYKWRITAKDVDGNEGDAECEFAIGNNPPNITNQYVKDFANRILLDYPSFPVEGATYDRRPSVHMTFEDEGSVTCGVQISSDSGFTPSGIKYHNEYSNVLNGTCVFNINNPLKPDIYFWRVYVQDKEGVRVYQYNPVWLFRILTVPDSGFGNIGIDRITNTIAGSPFIDDDEMNNAKRKHKYTWSGVNNDKLGHMSMGWTNFNPEGGGVFVEDTKLLGYAWNDYTGWMRMNCEESDEIGIEDDNICATSGSCSCDIDTGICSGDDFCVKNTPQGYLYGKARLEKFGGYVYFDLESCKADNLCKNDYESEWPASCDLKVCDAEEKRHYGVSIDSEGKFSGYAWNESIGWLDFNGEDVIPDPDDPNSMNYYYPITEWIGDKEPPVIGISGHHVFAATSNYDFTNETEPPTHIASDNSHEDKGFNCPEGIYAPPNNITPENEITIYNDAGVELSHFQLYCSEKVGPDRYAYLNLRLESQISTSPGVYKVAGNIYDAAGNEATIPNDENGFTFQVVASVPDFVEQVGTYNFNMNAKYENALADNVDEYVYNFNIRDRFGNYIISERLPNIPTVPDALKGSLLKEVETNVSFINTVHTDQVNPYPTYTGDAIIYNPLNDTRNYDDNSDKFTFTDDDKINNNNITIFISSIAPTDFLEGDDDNQIWLKNVSLKIENKLPDIYTNNKIGKCPSDTDCEMPLSGEEGKMTFAPLITMNLVSKDGHMYIDENGNSCDPDTDDDCSFASLGNYEFEESNPTVINVELVNNTDRTFDNIAWHTVMNTFDIDTNEAQDGVVRFDNMHVVSDIDASEMISDPDGICTMEKCTFSEHEETSFEEGLMSLDRLFSNNINQAIDIPFSSDKNNLFLSMTPIRILEVVGKDIGAKITSNIAYQFPGSVNANILYPVFVDSSGLSFLYREISIGGAAHGETIFKEAIRNPEDMHFVDVGKLLSYQEMLQSININVASATRGQRDEGKRLSEDEEVNVASWDELYNHDSATILNNGKVIWFHGDGFRLNINGNINIPSSKSPYTLIVEGGNIYLKGNIFDEFEKMNSNRSILGIIVLNSKVNQDNDKSGNLLIDPIVKNVKAILFAERSVLSFREDEVDGSTIYDGFNYEFDVLKNQLYWLGSIVSQNTVGGAQNETQDVEGNIVKDPKIPNYDLLWMPDLITCNTVEKFNNNTCSNIKDGDLSDKQRVAMRFDLAQLRLYKGGEEYSSINVPENLKQSSVIIEYDVSLNKIENVPPLLQLPKEFRFESIIR